MRPRIFARLHIFTLSGAVDDDSHCWYSSDVTELRCSFSHTECFDITALIWLITSSGAFSFSHRSMAPAFASKKSLTFCKSSWPHDSSHLSFDPFTLVAISLPLLSLVLERLREQLCVVKTYQWMIKIDFFISSRRRLYTRHSFSRHRVTLSQPCIYASLIRNEIEFFLFYIFSFSFHSARLLLIFLLCFSLFLLLVERV